MFVLGHIGIGRTLLGRARWRLPVLAFMVGALLPDLIDKPLYYSHLSSFLTSTRTFGHTGLFCGVLMAIAAATGAPAWWALALGDATHVVLDLFLDLFSKDPSSTWIALTWPFLHAHFALMPRKSPVQQLHEIEIPGVLIAEIIGGLLLVRDYRLRARFSAPQRPLSPPTRDVTGPATPADSEG